MIIRGGYNSCPREIEEVFYEHPAVLEAAEGPSRRMFSTIPWGDAGIEQQRSLPPVLLDPHQRGEAGLGDQRVGTPVSGPLLEEDRRSAPSASSAA
jgi:hypothetical protein